MKKTSAPRPIARANAKANATKVKASATASTTATAATSALRAAPSDWHAAADKLWHAGQRQQAFQMLLDDLNRHGARKPTPRVMQLVYYMFQAGDWHAAAGCLAQQHQTDPQNNEVLMNLAACLSRSGQPEPAVLYARKLLARTPNEPMVWDVLSNNLGTLGQWAEAAEAGTRSLVLKDQHSVAAHKLSAAQAAQAGRASAHAQQPAAAVPNPAALDDVLSFSLWGADRRYLWGTLDNLLAAKDLYPGWQVRIHLDDSVPAAWQALFAEQGADLRREPGGQLLREKLCWRFKVANDPAVRRFLVRDTDSVVSPREQAAVEAWLASGKRFHVMRDWWTHTDLMLAGMWGGTAGVLPDLGRLLATYTPRAMETPNIDQWFLRDRVWPLVRGDCLVHDRCFTMPGALPWPTPAPPGKAHVGQNLHAVDAEGQAARLAPWLARLTARA